MLPHATQTHLDQEARPRRRTIAVVTVSVTLLINALLWVQALWAGDVSLTPNFLVPLVVQAFLLVSVARRGVTGPLFVVLALTLVVGFLCSLFLPGARGAYVLIFFSAVPLFYILGGAVWGRAASAGFLGLTFTVILLRSLQLLPPWNLVAPRDSLLAALACVVLQFVIAEANERVHRSRLQALADHQFLEPNSGLPNRNALAQHRMAPGQSLVLVKFDNLAFDETWEPGRLGRALASLMGPGSPVFWVSEDEYAFLDPPEGPPEEVEAAVAQRLADAAVPGVGPRCPAQVLCIRAQVDEPASEALVEAELQLALRSRPLPVDRTVHRVQDLLKSLRACFAEGKLAAVFQPVYDGRAGGISALEALTRLDLGTLVSPEPYLGILESLGLDRQLTEFILNEAVTMGLETDYSVSLNLTYRDLEDAQFRPRILEACARFQNRRNKLILELTEHIAFSDQDLLNQFIAQVHDAGGLVFLDDFGMGYSNYASIALARFDAIKVAGSIVVQAQVSEELRVLLSGVVQFARASGIGLVAEHISDRDIYEMASGEGIRYFQGYLLQKPISGPAILAGDFQFGLDTDHELAVVVNSRSLPFEGGSRTPGESHVHRP